MEDFKTGANRKDAASIGWWRVAGLMKRMALEGRDHGRERFEKKRWQACEQGEDLGKIFLSFFYGGAEKSRREKVGFFFGGGFSFLCLEEFRN